MKIAFASSEVVPFAKTGGMADVCGTLPFSLARLGVEVVIIMPLYKTIDRKHNRIKETDRGLFETVVGCGIKVYFVDQEKYFGREGIYGTQKGDFPDNLERFQFFCWKTLEILKSVDFKADIIHCHDWQTALIAAYLKFNLKNDAFYKNMKSIFTIHNMAYQGVFPKKEFPKLKLDQKLFGVDGFEFYDQVNLLKGGILFSDCVSTVSPQYAKEIQTAQQGCGLDGVLRSRKTKISGILNGLDYDSWNPKTDPLIAHPFSAGDLAGKTLNKKRLQEMFNLPAKNDVPVLGFVGRLSHQKGLDLIAEGMEDLLALDAQFVFLGVGDEKSHRMLEKFSHSNSNKMAIALRHDEETAHQVYAGSDLFLMPSVYEPCGLSQMISLRYGTIPVVFKTGGLADTIKPFDTKDGNGFVFEVYKKEPFVKTVKKACEVYKDKKIFTALMARAFACDFSWDHSAKEYVKLYESVTKS